MTAIIRKALCLILSTIIFVLSGLFEPGQEKIHSVSSVRKVVDGFYTMNYTYDYDIDKLLEDGVSTHVSLIFKGLGSALLGGMEGFGCTTFNSVTPEGDYLFGRNFDYTESEYMLVWTDPEDGYASVSSVALIFNGYDADFTPESEVNRALTLLAPYAPLDGINEKGLSVGILELSANPVFQVTEKVNLTTTTMVRAVLDKAATVAEAIEIFRSYDMRDFLFGGCTYHYHVADADGNSAVIEYIDGKINVIYPEKKQDSAVDYLVAANYYLTAGVSDPGGLGYERTDRAYAALDAAKGVTDEREAMNILKSVSMKDEDLHGYICSTLWSAVYNMNDRSVQICYGNDFSKTYSFSLDKPQTVLSLSR